MKIKSKEVFRATPQVIWEYLTNLENQNWRKNITYIETNPDGSEFVEHTGDEGDMSYKVVASQPGQIYEVNFENESKILIYILFCLVFRKVIFTFVVLTKR